MDSHWFNGEDNRDSLTTPDVASDEFDDCPEDDAYTYTDEDARNYLEEQQDGEVTR